MMKPRIFDAVAAALLLLGNAALGVQIAATVYIAGLDAIGTALTALCYVTAVWLVLAALKSQEIALSALFSRASQDHLRSWQGFVVDTHEIDNRTLPALPTVEIIEIKKGGEVDE